MMMTMTSMGLTVTRRRTSISPQTITPKSVGGWSRDVPTSSVWEYTMMQLGRITPSPAHVPLPKRSKKLRVMFARQLLGAPAKLRSFAGGPPCFGLFSAELEPGATGARLKEVRAAYEVSFDRSWGSETCSKVNVP